MSFSLQDFQISLERIRKVLEHREQDAPIRIYSSEYQLAVNALIETAVVTSTSDFITETRLKAAEPIAAEGPSLAEKALNQVIVPEGYMLVPMFWYWRIALFSFCCVAALVQVFLK